ncbi:MAG: helix-turn-helix domain-containing protein [Gammaproteobacteria bacterium]|nr:helix-turn-helix domain-containing protein [Gammaproteobacteria bacterium]
MPFLERQGKSKEPYMPMGERIKRRRKELGLTLQQLAEKSGLSAPFISQAERDVTVPSLVSLLGLSRALDVDLDYFMQIGEIKNVVHRAARPNRVRVDSPVDYVDLSSAIPERKMDVILMRIPPGHVFPVDQRNGEDFLYLLEGELFATAGKTQTVLKAGDSMHFDSRLPHTARNTSTKEAVLLYVGTPSVFQKPKSSAVPKSRRK